MDGERPALDFCTRSQSEIRNVPISSLQTALDDIIPRNMRISTSRVTEADEVANLVAFLASPRAANITGAEFVIDSGQIKTT
jgi:NAD(P)-dependent dehydrogenase (short-subunit alcohol dehydrogenase family)